jgi:hypothetical protein
MLRPSLHYTELDVGGWQGRDDFTRQTRGFTTSTSKEGLCRGGESDHGQRVYIYSLHGLRGEVGLMALIVVYRYDLERRRALIQTQAPSLFRDILIR